MKHLFLGLGMAVAAVASADTFPSVEFLLSDGSTLSVPSDGLSITFNDGHLLASHANGVSDLLLTDLNGFRFSSETTAVSAIEAVSAETDVYSTTGIFMGRFSSGAEARTSLPKGIYIFKYNGETAKVCVK